ncbi:hypothetical protein DFH28DRAFT_923693 [Melampsora americana]|nr:hypothetical protein DFH28DRAFT_923693 [Melampsora americana]
MSTRTNVIPHSVRECGDVLDEEPVLPSMKRACSHSPISNALSTPIENYLELTQDCDFTNLLDGPSIDSPSQAHRASPTPENSSKIESSASYVHNLLVNQLPTRDEKEERTKLKKNQCNLEEKYMKAEQEAQQEELQTQAKLADTISCHLSGVEDFADEAKCAKCAQLKLEQVQVQLDLAESQLARSCEDFITARSECKLFMLAKYKAMGKSIEEAKKEVEEAEEQLQNFKL